MSEAPESYEGIIEEAGRVVPKDDIEWGVRDLAGKYSIMREDGQLVVYKEGNRRMGTTDEFVHSYAATVEGKYGDAATAYARKSFSVIRLAALPEWIRRYSPSPSTGDGDRLDRAA